MKKRLLLECERIAKEFYPKHPERKRRNRFIHYSFVIINNEIIGFGINRIPPINFPKLNSYEFDSMIHAEVDAFFRYKHLMKNNKFTIVNIRINNDCQLKISKPCKCCEKFLNAIGATNVYYSTDYGFVQYA